MVHKIFSNSVGFFFFKRCCFFYYAAFEFYVVTLLIFGFVVCAFGPKKLLPISISISLFPKFSSRSFMVSSLMFKTLINFKLIYELYEIKVQFHCFICLSPVVLVLLLKRSSSPHRVFLVSLLNIS